MIASVVVLLFVSDRADDQSATDTHRNTYNTTTKNTSQINDSNSIRGNTGSSRNNCCADRANGRKSSSRDGTNTRRNTRGGRNDSRLEG